MPAPARVRDRVDACPGVFAPHDAADGALARVRLPGGSISASGLRVVADCAEELGDGRVHLTSRGNVQLRGLTRTPALAERLAEAGLLPSATHERVRNVLASALSGVAGGAADVRGMAPALDRGLCARPGLAAVPGRFLFALDDGRGDVAAEEPDLCWQAVSASSGVLRVAGVAVAAVGAAEAVPTLLDAAEAFLVLRVADGGTAWRAAELADAPARIAAVLGLVPADDGLRPSQQGGLTAIGLVQGHPAANPTTAATTAAAPPPAPTPGPRAGVPGPVLRDDGGVAFVVAPLLGELTADQVRLLADAAAPTSVPAAVVTPWRTVVLPDPRLPAAHLAAHLAAAGLVVAPGAAADVSACAGRPGCAKALADVRADVRAALGVGSVVGPSAGRLPAGRVHVSGCTRRCGAPRTAHVDAVALAGGGYLVDGVPRPGLLA